MQGFLRGWIGIVARASLTSLVALVAWGAFPSGALAQEEGVVAEATRLYDQSRFDDAIKMINDAVQAGRLGGDELQRAREILARSYVKTGQRQEGKETFKAILRVDSGYRPDPVRTPPDEMDVFNMALKERERELIEMGQRIPTSVSGYIGYGMYDLGDLNDQFVSGNPGTDEIKGGFEFGGQIRVPVRSRFSLDVELGHFQGETEDPSGDKLQAVGMPLFAGVAWSFWSRPRLRASGLLAAGALLKAGVQAPFLGSDVLISLTKTGFYSHVGLEGEFLPFPRYSIVGRAVYRVATASGIGETDTNEGFDAEFSGLALHAGVRAYVGY